jgi:thiol-disulfide isomerase/thioredoxin
VSAKIDDGWHLYSLEQPQGGPLPTRIGLPEGQDFKLAGTIGSPLPLVLFDPNFNLDTQFYEREAEFTLPIEVFKSAAPGKQTLIVSAYFQTCNDTKCLPPKAVKMTTVLEIVVANKGEYTPAVKAPNELDKTNPADPTKKDELTGIVEFDFVDFAGKKRKLSEFRGKYVLLDFWATWCKPCLVDIPKLKSLYEKYKSSGFEIIGMDSETIGDEAEAPDPEFAKQAEARARQIVSTRGIAWTQAMNDTAVPVAIKVFGVKALPTKVMIDREGRIVATIGEKDDLAGIVETLLSTKQ